MLHENSKDILQVFKGSTLYTRSRNSLEPKKKSSPYHSRSFVTKCVNDQLREVTAKMREMHIELQHTNGRY